jgi:hypothetical protein
MKRKITRWFLPLLVALLGVLVFVTPCLAINPPDDLDITGVWAYRNCRETGDQLYLVEYSINYTPMPSETVTEAYLCRLMDGATELASTPPIWYNTDNKGYGVGVVAIYFEAIDAPTWQGAYTMKLMGNPFISWNGSVPETSYSTFDVWQDNDLGITKSIVSSRVLYLAQEVEDDWGKDMVTLADTGKSVLTDYGLGYFINVIPYLADVAPYIYAAGQSHGGGIIPPEIPPEEARTDYADSLTADIIGTPLDVTPVATIFGVSRGALTAVLYYGIVLVVLITVARRIGSYRPVMLFGGFLMIVGSFVGVPLMVAILGALAGFGMIGFCLFYKPSSA